MKPLRWIHTWELVFYRAAVIDRSRASWRRYVKAEPAGHMAAVRRHKAGIQRIRFDHCRTERLAVKAQVLQRLNSVRRNYRARSAGNGKARRKGGIDDSGGYRVAVDIQLRGICRAQVTSLKYYMGKHVQWQIGGDIRPVMGFIFSFFFRIWGFGYSGRPGGLSAYTLSGLIRKGRYPLLSLSQWFWGNKRTG